MTFLKWIINPFSLISLLLIVIAITSMGLAYQSVSHDNKLLKDQIGQAEQVIETQEKSIGILQQDTGLIDKLMSSKQTIIIKENELQKQLDEIPDTSTNKPFTNPDLLAAANLVRAYQHSFDPVDSTSSSSR